MTVLTHIICALAVLYGATILLFIVGLMRKPAGKNATLHQVSVVIAARNEQENIGHLLNDLIKQDYPPELFDVTIVDDNSVDDTASIVSEFAQKQANIKLLSVENIPNTFSPKKYALQQAVQQASGKIILTTDADCRLPETWIRSMVRYFADEVGFVIGFSQLGSQSQKQNLIEKLQAFDFIQLMGAAAGTANLGFPLASSGQNMAYRRDAFLRVNGYQRVAHRVSGDDVLLLQLVRRFTNYKIVFASDPSAFVTSKPEPTLWSFINQRKRWASNGSYQLILNPLFFVYLLQVFLYNAGLLVGIPLALVTGHHLPLLLVCLFIRAGLEIGIGIKSTHYFRRQDLLTYFPVWFVLQIPYIVFVGAMGTFGRFNWKERSHSADVG